MAKIYSYLVFSLLAFALVRSVQASTQQACKDSKITLLGVKEITEEVKQKLLDLHNYYRELVASGKGFGQPKAENMIELKWDDYAAQKASSMVSQCELQLSDVRNENNQPMGLNFRLQMSIDKEDVNKTFNDWVGRMVEKWYSESAKYNYDSKYNSGTGRYAQLVWANTTTVGCGYSYFQERKYKNVGFLACYYEPPSVMWQKPYIKGDVDCQAHGLVRSSNEKYKHLCVKNGN
uniref:Putative scp-like extracellular protein n=1 Tax=Triatoma infestans TaxID=30076 RepID=A0A023FBC1_TRIIF